MKNWKLTSVVTAYFNDNTVYFSDAETTKFQESVRKMAGKTCQMCEIDNSLADFKIKINSGKVLIKSCEFPDSKYYRIGNFYEEELLNLLENTNINKGEVSESFEVVFNPNAPTVCYLLCSSMPEWTRAVEDLKRRIIVSNSKKTTKFIPGHRYDLVDNSIIYLGEFTCHHDTGNYTNGIYKQEGYITKFHAYIKDVDLSKYSSVSDVFNDKLFNTNLIDSTEFIYFIEKLSSRVDAGEVLKDDFDTINAEDLILSQINLYMKRRKHQYSKLTDLYYYENIDEVFRLFSYSNTTAIPGNLEIKGKITKIIEKNFEYLLEEGYNTDKSPYGCKISKSINNADNARNLSKLLFSCGNEPHLDKIKYYGEILNKLGIDYIKIAETVLKTLVPEFTKYETTVEGILNHDIYFRSHYFEKYFRTIDLRYNNKATIKSAFGSGLGDVVTKIYDDCTQNNGKWYNQYNVINEGSFKNPYLTCTIEITLDNIIDYYGGIDKLPGEIKSDIIAEKFYKIIIQGKL